MEEELTQVYLLARKWRVSSHEMLKIAHRLRIEVRNQLSYLNAGQLAEIEQYLHNMMVLSKKPLPN
jgi:hypothetical protein